MAEKWINLDGVSINITKCKSYLRSSMTPREWSSLHRAVANTEAGKSIINKNDNRASSAILIISNKLILVV